MDWLLRRLAERLGVTPAGVGESSRPYIHFDQPLAQGPTLLILVGSLALIAWLYRREGPGRPVMKTILAGLRFSLVLLTLFMLTEAVLSVDRTGLPYFVVMVDDSASQGVVDNYADAQVKADTAKLGAESGRPAVDRLALAQGFLAKDDGKFLRELQKRHRVRVYFVSDATRALPEVDKPDQIPGLIATIRKAEPRGDQSRLGTGVRQVLTELRGVLPTAIVLLTDGQTTEGESVAKAAEFAARKGVPLYPIGLGDPEAPRDIEIGELLVDDVVFVDDLVRFQPKLTARGYAGQELTVRLKQKTSAPGSTEQTKELSVIRVPAPPDGQATRLELQHRPKQTGPVTYIVEVDAQPREQTAGNNRVEKLVTVREEKLRVLYVDSEPRYEFRYLKTFLDREKTIDLNVVLQSSDPQYSNQDRAALSTFPSSKEELFDYDAVILGDVDPGFLSGSQMTHLVEFVTTRGGGILFVAGENYDPLAFRGTPLESLLPIDLNGARNPTAVVGGATAGFRPALTVEGRANPIFRFADDDAASARIWAFLPELLWYFEAPKKKPAAVVLAQHPTQRGPDGPLPIMVYQIAGSGKAMFHAVDDTWRWRWRAGDRYFGRFWTQTIRFLARSKLLGQKKAEIRTERRRYQRNQPIEVKVRFPNPGDAPTNGEVVVEVEHQGHGSRRLVLRPSPGSKNLFEGIIPQAVEGDYEVRLLPPPILEGGLPTTRFAVDAPAGEREHVEMNQAELVRAAAVSHGKFYLPTAADGLLGDLPTPQQVPLDTDPPIPLWNTWPVLVLFLMVLVAEWVLRKRARMV